MSNNIIVKLQDSNDPKTSKEKVKINKIISSISPSDFVKLLNKVETVVNPRDPKPNKVTKNIYETLDKSPELFWFKSKGILLATEQCDLLDRNRVRLSLNTPEYEGIMDGGHNAFAIASFYAEKLFGKTFKEWKYCKAFWKNNFDEIEKRFQENLESLPDFSIPVEILYPNGEEGSMDEFYDHISEICSARNTNVELKSGILANKEGHYDYLKEKLPEYKYQIIWKGGMSGKIKSEDVISMATIPLIFLQENNLLPEDLKFQLSKVSIYSQKSRCVDFFTAVLEHEKISERNDGHYNLKDSSSYVKSALDLVEDIMLFFDKLTIEFPNLYNDVSPRFGGIKKVTDFEKNGSKKPNSKPKSKPTLFHTRNITKYDYPLGYIYPLVTGITELIEIDRENKKVAWKTSPLMINLEELEMEQYVEAFQLVNYDPQGVGKSSLFYSQAKSIFETYLLKRGK